MPWELSAVSGRVHPLSGLTRCRLEPLLGALFPILPFPTILRLFKSRPVESLTNQIFMRLIIFVVITRTKDDHPARFGNSR
jgi:hypothetical protein